MAYRRLLSRPCVACGHHHDPASSGPCWKAHCLPDCPEHRIPGVDLYGLAQNA